MAKVKINSVGFGYDKYLKMSDGLTWAGILLIVVGQSIQTRWYVGKDQKAIEVIRKLHACTHTK